MRLKQRDSGALLGQMQGGGQPGEAAADDADIDTDIAIKRRCRQRRRSRCCPQRGFKWKCSGYD